MVCRKVFQQRGATIFSEDCFKSGNTILKPAVAMLRSCNVRLFLLHMYLRKLSTRGRTEIMKEQARRRVSGGP